MRPAYDYFDKIVRHRAWNPRFFETLKADIPEYKRMTYEQAFYEWTNSFTATWPNLLKEPDSELAKAEKVQMDAALDAYEKMKGDLDPENKAKLAMWLQDQLNGRKLLFTGAALNLDFEAMAEYVPPQPMGFGGEEEKRPSGERPKPKLVAKE